MKTLKECPICKNDKFSHYLECEDYIQSHKKFSIVNCEGCGFKFTNPRPDDNNIMKYYQSKSYTPHQGMDNWFLNIVYKTIGGLRIRIKYNLIKKESDGNSILDIGCGSGEFLSYFKKRGWQAVGIETDEKTRIRAQKKYNLKIGGPEMLNALPNNSFDVITLWHSLEHLTNLNEIMLQIKRLLKSNGLIVVAVPNHESKDAQIYKSMWAAYDVPRHLYHFSKKTIKKLFNNYGFNQKEIIPIKIDAYYNCLISEKHKKSRTSILSATINGLNSNIQAKNLNNYSSLTYLFTKK